MISSNYLSTLQAYQSALDDLYRRPPKAERGAAGVTEMPDLEDRAQRVVDNSQALGQSLRENLTTDDPNVRELAGLQMVASAAMDLQVADDLAKQAKRRRPAAPERSATGEMAALQKILSTPPEAGVKGLVRAGVQRGAKPRDIEEARKKLIQAAKRTVDGISEDAASLGPALVKNLLKIPEKALQDAGKEALDTILAKLGEGASALLRKAASLVASAIDKLLALLGKDVQDEARQKVQDWINDLKKEAAAKKLLGRVYGVDQILADVQKQVTAAPAGLGVDAFNNSVEGLQELAKKYRKQKEVIALLLAGLSTVTPWIMSLQPWGPVGLAAGYTLTIGYVVYAGGDYVDWFWTGERLNLVPGVRTVVRQSLSTA